MIIYEFKVKAQKIRLRAIDEAIRTSQFIQNKCLRFWMDNEKVSKYDLNKYCAVLAKEFSFASELNSMARQSAAERALAAIANRRHTAVLLAIDQLYRVSTTTARKINLGKKATPSLKSIAVQWNIKPLDGSCQKIVKPLLSLIRKI